MQPWRIWIESKIHNNSIELAQNNTLNSRIFRLCHHSQFWKPWSPRPPVLLSFAFVHQLSAVFIFVASFGFCLLDHKSNQKKTVHMRGPCCFEMVWNLKYMFFFQQAHGYGSNSLPKNGLMYPTVNTISRRFSWGKPILKATTNDLRSWESKVKSPNQLFQNDKKQATHIYIYTHTYMFS